MIGADTNVLLRGLLHDHPGQAAEVVRFLESARAAGEPVLIPTIVLCEAVWTLRTQGRWSREQVAEALETLFVADAFVIEEEDLVAAALRQYRHGKGDFADYLIGQVSRARGCRHTVTFDKGLLGTAGFVAVSNR